MMHSHTLNVLIVDDNPLITLFISDIVIAKGENVVAVCHHSDCALEAIKRYKPDLIFMDINIKGPLDGITVIRKSLNYHPIIYFVSAYNSEEVIEDALSVHAYNYLIKPIKESDIDMALKLSQREIKSKPSSLSHKTYLSENIYFDQNSDEIISKNSTINLSIKEQQLIKLFVKNLNTNLSINCIKEELWLNESVTDSTIRDHISSLRKKLPELKIETNFGRGYLLHSF